MIGVEFIEVTTKVDTTTEPSDCVDEVSEVKVVVVGEKEDVGVDVVTTVGVPVFWERPTMEQEEP